MSPARPVTSSPGKVALIKPTASVNPLAAPPTSASLSLSRSPQPHLRLIVLKAPNPIPHTYNKPLGPISISTPSAEPNKLTYFSPLVPCPASFATAYFQVYVHLLQPIRMLLPYFVCTRGSFMPAASGSYRFHLASVLFYAFALQASYASRQASWLRTRRAEVTDRATLSWLPRRRYCASRCSYLLDWYVR